MMMPTRLAILTLLLALLAPLAAAQIRVLPAPAEVAGNHFGSAVALSGDIAVVGASGEDACGPNSGAAYVYRRNAAGGFDIEGRLEASQCQEGRFFGRSVAVSGNRAAITAGGDGLVSTRPNSVHVFERQPGGAWQEVAILLPPDGDGDSAFGAALSMDRDRLAVAMAGGAARISARGAVYVYERQPGSGWRQTARLLTQAGAGRIFGSDVSLEGNRLAVTASPYSDRGTASVHIFEREDGGGWEEQAVLDGLEAHTLRIALAGSVLVAGESGAGPDRAGRVSVYGRRSDGSWRLQSTLLADVPYRHGAFGSLVALERTPAGPRVLAVGYTEQLGRETNIDRVVHVFGYDAERGWTHRQILDVGDWAFGMAIAVAGGTALVGRAADHLPGAVYAVELLD